jgi:hypothetical protein
MRRCFVHVYPVNITSIWNVPKKVIILFKEMSRGSSGSIVSDYVLDDRGSIPDRGRGFFSGPCLQIGSGAHLASYKMGTGGKAWPERDADHSPTSSAEVKYE